MKTQSNFKFNPLDKERWQECADKITRGNLSQWIEMELNKASDRLLGKRKKKDLKRLI